MPIMGWLSFKEDNEDHSQETQDNKPLQNPQPSSGSSNSISASNPGGAGLEYNVDNEPGSTGGSGAHE